MGRLGLLIGLAGAAVVACRSPDAPIAAGSLSAERECEIVGVAIRSMVDGSAPDPLVVRDSASVIHTVTGESGTLIRLDSQLVEEPAEAHWLIDSLDLSRSTVADFVARNAQPSLACVPAKVDGMPVLKGPQPRIADLRSGRRPLIVWVSRVGVNAAGTEALLSVEMVCGGLCGNGQLMVLRLSDDGKWAVSRQIELWVS